MKKVTLKSLSLVNFKGIEQTEIEFSPNNTFISGDNGTGKTTIFDAFTWLLFGKDSSNRSDSNFNIKRLDANGKPILHLEHSVTGVLDVDGTPVKLCRRFAEKWGKPRGSEEEVFQGHQTLFSMNDVAISTKSEYDSIVSDICSEEVFRMITNPGYFFSLKAEQQKALLLDMAGEIDDRDVAGGRSDFHALVETISGVGFERYMKELAARKRAIKTDIASIPASIESLQRVIPAELMDETELASAQKELADDLAKVDAKLASDAEKCKGAREKVEGLQRELTALHNKIYDRAEAIRTDIREKNARQVREQQDLQSAIALQENAKRALDAQYEYISNQITDKEKELKAMRDRFAAENAKSIAFSADEFICPTCHRPLDVADIEARQSQMLENFNRTKAERLSSIRAEGKEMKAQQEALIAKCNSVIEQQTEAKEMLDHLYAQEDALQFRNPVPVDAQRLIDTDKEIDALKDQARELEMKINYETPIPTDESLKSEKTALQARIKELASEEEKIHQAAKIQTEITALEDRRVSSNQALADLEREEYTATEFQKAKDNALMERINGLFQRVRFSFVGEQINGGEKLTCTCMVDGVPYADANNASKINAGLDIINAVCNAKGIAAPIFVDNAEAVNVLLPTTGQKVELRVSKDAKLTTSVYSN